MLAAGALGALWALGVVWVGAALINLPIFVLTPTLLVAFIGPGVTLAVMILWVSWRRYPNHTGADGDAMRSGSAEDIDARVLGNTLEQVVLALCLWPAIGFLAADDGPGMLTALSMSFPISRLAFWVGFRVSPPLRLFGFAATFHATLFALAWAILVWFV